MTIFDRITELSNEAGGLRAAARRLGLNAGFLCQLRSGKKKAGPHTLQKLGLRCVVDYVRDKHEETQAV